MITLVALPILFGINMALFSLIMKRMNVATFDTGMLMSLFFLCMGVCYALMLGFILDDPEGNTSKVWAVALGITLGQILYYFLIPKKS